jgi:ubiquinone/menaquinone biosynthesis C-methylase UbiE/uncharacterized protein YbaR (Trm112 family)
MIDPWLKENLVCPRTHEPLEWHEDCLTSAAGHRYPILDGVPIMLVDGLPDTNPVRFDTTRGQLSDPLSLPPDPNLGKDEVDPYVRDQVMCTCGHMYEPIRHTMKRYPIPDIRLPEVEGTRMLDIGCGWGRWSVAAARKGYVPVGIDPSIDRVRAARRILKQFGHQGTFVVADARRMPFRDNTFKVVFSFSVLQHFAPESMRMALAEVKRVLRPDGYSKIQMAVLWGPRNIMMALKKKLTGRRGPFLVRFWPQGKLRRTFTELIGPTTVTVDGFFSLGAQTPDLELLPWKYRCVVRSSDFLRGLCKHAGWLGQFADSIYLQSEPAKKGS